MITNKNRIRFALSGLSDIRSNRVGALDDSMAGHERYPTKWGDEYIRFVGLISNARDLTSTDLTFWWSTGPRFVFPTDNRRAPRTDAKLMADRLVRILVDERCIYVAHERGDVVRFAKTQEFEGFLEQILRIEESLLDSDN